MSALVSVMVAICLFGGSTSATATRTRIPAGTIECFSQQVESGASLAFTFRVTHGGQKDLDVTLVASSVEDREDDDSQDSKKHHISSLTHTMKTRMIESWTKATEGRSTFRAATASENGHGLPTKVTACFNNKESRWTPKWFEFELFSDPSEPAAGEKEALSSAETQLEHALHAEGNNLFKIRTLMTRLKHSEEVHRNKVESTNEWTLYGTIVNGLLLMGLSVFQFWYLKRFLSVRHISLRM